MSHKPKEDNNYKVESFILTTLSMEVGYRMNEKAQEHGE